MNQDKKINILVASDVHGDSYQFDNIKKYYRALNKNYDYIFYLGDFDSLLEKEQNDEFIINESVEIIGQMLTLMETICPNVYYIGGNHDPGVLFSDSSPKLGKTSVNIHKRVVRIENDILITGIGGCVPSIESKNEHDFHKYKIDNYDNIIWKGYPYMNYLHNKDETISYSKSDALFGKDINKTFTLLDSIKKENDIVILLSHVGAFQSQTSNRFKNGNCIYTGSVELEKVINKYNDEIILNLHGHTHPSPGIIKIGNTYIFNPGSLRKGNFGEVSLQKNNNKWIIKEIKQLNIGKN